MAAPINITNVEVFNNPARFSDPFQFKIQFQCIPPGIQEELEWKVIYVGSAEDESYDQELDSVSVGPISIGLNEFLLETENTPDVKKIPRDDLLEVTVVFLSCLYKTREFLRVGYYVNNEYLPPGWNSETSVVPEVPEIQYIRRSVNVAKPRITKFFIPWDNSDEILLPSAEEEAEAKAHDNAPDDVILSALPDETFEEEDDMEAIEYSNDEEDIERESPTVDIDEKVLHLSPKEDVKKAQMQIFLDYLHQATQSQQGGQLPVDLFTSVEAAISLRPDLKLPVVELLSLQNLSPTQKLQGLYDLFRS